MSDSERELLELIQLYPSPHNGQPMRLERTSESTFDVWFVTDRGLTATPISARFSFVTIGVFLEYVQACGEALGHVITVSENLPKEADMLGSSKELACGSIVVKWNDIQPSETRLAAIRFRQTSRKKYTSGLSNEEKTELEAMASGEVRLSFVDEATSHQVVWLNQRAVFDDMFDEPVRNELRQWMRTSHEEKVAKRDGLSYDCMEMSGSALKFFLNHYQIIRWPVISGLLKRYYLRTMRDNSSVGYLSASFANESDACAIGRVIMRIWLKLSEQGTYLHPFGTIVSNDEAHADFLRLVHKEEAEDSYVAFIFRAGRSSVPVRSERLPLDQLIRGNHA